MKFLADMCISPRCVEWLRAQGHDAIHLFEEKLQQLPDSFVRQRKITTDSHPPIF